MTPHDELKGLLVRLRQGDESAVAELYRNYRDIAVTVLAGLAGTRLGRTVSVSEQVQSGMVQILMHLDTLALDVTDLPVYLRAMARNKLRDRRDKQTAQKRDIDKEEYGEAALDGLRSDDPTPSAVVVRDEEYEAVMSSVSAEERVLLEGWMAEYSWADIAEMTGLPTAEAARKRCERLIDRLRQGHVNPDAASPPTPE